MDWIPLKALEKERSRRYETVNGLVLDLQRYLAGEPVEAAPPSRTYRIGKFVRKHRPWIAAAAAFALVLIAGIAVSTWMAVRATRAEQESRAINDFLQVDVLGQANPSNQSGPGGKADALLTVRTALDRAASKLDGKFAQQPLVEASLRHTIGSAYWSLGVLPQAQTHLEAAVKLRTNVLGAAPPTLQSQSALGGLLWQAGNLKLGLLTAGGFLAGTAGFALIGWMCLKSLQALRGLIDHSSWRFAVTALQRRPAATVVQIVACGSPAS